MKSTYEALAGTVDLDGTKVFHNDKFGYTLYEEVVDPENPKGPRGIAMHVPANSLSKVWQLVEPGYEERIELLSGSATLMVFRENSDEQWTPIHLTYENPTADGIVISEGDKFCLVTGDEDAVILSRPSKPFDISFEVSMSRNPTDTMSKFILARVASIEL